MKLNFLLILCFVLLNSINAQELEQTKETSKVEFKIKNFGINVDGHFGTVSISPVFNSEHELTDLSAAIKVSSIITGMEGRDAHILKEDFFDEPNYKTISLTSTKTVKVSSNSFQVDANLTIKDITKKVSIPISLSTQNDVITITSDFEINRIDYGVGGRSLILGKTVKIYVKHSYSN